MSLSEDIFTPIADKIREKYNIEDSLTRAQIIEKLNEWVPLEEKDIEHILSSSDRLPLYIKSDSFTINPVIKNFNIISFICPKAQGFSKIDNDLNNFSDVLYAQHDLVKIDCSFPDFPHLGGCPKLCTVILRNAKTVTLPYYNYLSSTKIAEKQGYIYVPSSLLEQYKIATNWVIYADQIRAIEDYPDITGGALE